MEIQQIDLGQVAFNPKGNWSADATYKHLNVVYYKGRSYYAKLENTNQPPSMDSDFWGLMVDGGDVTNNVDEEDVTSMMDEDGKSVIKFADRAYDPDRFSGKGYKILRKNMQNVRLAVVAINVTKAPTADGELSVTINNIDTHITLSATDHNTTELTAQAIADALTTEHEDYDVVVTDSTVKLTRKFGEDVPTSAYDVAATGMELTLEDSVKTVRRNLLTPIMVSQPNTIYEIRYDFDLNGGEMEIPENCVLKFEGGSLNNGILNNSYYIINKFEGTAINNYSVIEYNSFVRKNNILYQDKLSGNIKDNILTKLLKDEVFQYVERQSLIENAIIKNELDKNGICFDTKATNAPQSNLFRFLNICNFKIGVSLYNNGYSNITDTLFYSNGIGISIDSDKNWCGAINITCCHFVSNDTAIKTNKSSSIAIDNCIFERNTRCLDLHKNVIINSCYFGDSKPKENDAAIVIEAGSNVLFENCVIGVAGSNIGNSFLFDLLGTDDNPCMLTLRNCHIELDNQKNTDLFLYKTTSNKNKIIIENCEGAISSNVQHNRHICRLFDNNNIVAKTSNKNYILNGYFNDDVQNEIYKTLYGNIDFISEQTICSEKCLHYTGIKKTIYFCYKIEENQINKPMQLFLGFKVSNNKGLIIVYENSDLVKETNRDLAFSSDHITDVEYTVIPTKQVGVIALCFNSINSSTEDFYLYYVGLKSINLKNKINNLKSFNDYYFVPNYNNLTKINSSIDKPIFVYNVIDCSIKIINNNLVNDIINNETNRRNILEGNVVYDAINKTFAFNVHEGYRQTKLDRFGLTYIGETNNRPDLYSVEKGFLYFDVTLNKPVWWDGSKWIDKDGNNPDKLTKGTTLQRPSGISEGFEFYDTTLKKKILWNGSAWVNIDGTTLE